MQNPYTTISGLVLVALAVGLLIFGKPTPEHYTISAAILTAGFTAIKARDS